MRNSAPPIVQVENQSFDLFRLSKSKQLVDLASNTLREYNRRGLKFYRQGRATFVSRAELTHFIRTQAA
jgi:hypothetical protein